MKDPWHGKLDVVTPAGFRQGAMLHYEPLLQPARLRPVFAASSEQRVLHIGAYYRGLNDIVRHMMLGLRGAGYLVHEYNTDEHQEALDTDGRRYDRGAHGPVWLRWSHLEPLVTEFRPDVIVCNAGGLSFRPEVAARLRRDIRLLGIALSDPEVYEPATRHIAPNFDFFLTNDPGCLPGYREAGVNAGRLPVGVLDDFFKPAAVRPELICDVLFMGEAYACRIEPVRALIEHFDVHVYGEAWEEHGIRSRGAIYGDDSLAALRSARSSVVLSRTRSGHEIVKVGVFNFLAAGGFVVTEHLPELENYFDVGRELITFKSTAEMVERIQYFLTHPDERQEIVEKGRDRVLRDYTWAKVWPRIMRRVLE